MRLWRCAAVLAWVSAPAACSHATKPTASSGAVGSPAAVPAGAHPSAPAVAGPIDAIFASYASGRVPGCAVGVYRGGDVAFAKGYGLADIERGAPIDDRTVFDVGSVSKQFTAAAVALLVGEKKIALDDDVRKYLPELPDYGKTITLSHLLHHTSGLRDYVSLLVLSGFDFEAVTDNDDALRVLVKQRGLNFVPGKEFSYSNSGYFLLSLIVARVSGETFATFCKKRIFDPLGMADTHVHDDHARVVLRRATGYDEGADGTPEIVMSDFEQTGDGAVMTTVRDLARWDANFYAPAVGGPQLVATLRTRGRLDDGTTLGYAMGLSIGSAHGVAREAHDGATPGYRATIARFPTARLAVAVLCNDGSANAAALADAVASRFLPPHADEPPVTLDVDPAAIRGSYIDPLTLDVRTVRAIDCTLAVGFGVEGGGPRALVAAGPRELVLKGGTTRYAFEAASGATPARLVQKPLDGRAVALERFEPPPPLTAAALAEYAGRYESDEIAQDLWLEVVDGKLVESKWGRRRERTLSLVVRDGFSGGALSFRFERDRRGHVTGIIVGSDRMRGIRFDRREPRAGQAR